MKNELYIRGTDGIILGTIPNDAVDAGIAARHIPFPAKLALSKEQLERLSIENDRVILITSAA